MPPSSYSNRDDDLPEIIAFVANILHSVTFVVYFHFVAGLLL